MAHDNGLFRDKDSKYLDGPGVRLMILVYSDPLMILVAEGLPAMELAPVMRC